MDAWGEKQQHGRGLFHRVGWTYLAAWGSTQLHVLFPPPTPPSLYLTPSAEQALESKHETWSMLGLLLECPVFPPLPKEPAQKKEQPCSSRHRSLLWLMSHREKGACKEVGSVCSGDGGGEKGGSFCSLPISLGQNPSPNVNELVCTMDGPDLDPFHTLCTAKLYKSVEEARLGEPVEI